MWFYSETGGFFPNRVSTLEEVLSIHLKVVPSSQLSSLQMKSQLTKVRHTLSSHICKQYRCAHASCRVPWVSFLQEEMEMWQKRPCPVPLLKLMALSVIHLRPLRLALLDNLMMDYMALVDSYINSSFYEPDELQHVSMVSHLHDITLAHGKKCVILILMHTFPCSLQLGQRLSQVKKSIRPQKSKLF